MKARPSDVAAAHLQRLLAALREDKARQMQVLREHERRRRDHAALMRRLRFYLPPPPPTTRGRKR